MKVYIADGLIVCSMDNKNSAFLSQTAGCFDGFHHKDLKLSTEGAGKLYHLGMLIRAANAHDIEIAPEVKAVYEQLRRSEEETRAKCMAELRESERRRSAWAFVQKHGCLNCEHCRQTEFDDDWECGATNENLPTQNSPGYNGMTYSLFNIKPFPTDNCPLKF